MFQIAFEDKKREWFGLRCFRGMAIKNAKTLEEALAWTRTICEVEGWKVRRVREFPLNYSRMYLEQQKLERLRELCVLSKKSGMSQEEVKTKIHEIMNE